MKVLQLILPVAKSDRQMHQKDQKVLQLELDHKTLDTIAKIMKFLRHNPLVGEKRIALFVQHRHFLYH